MRSIHPAGLSAFIPGKLSRKTIPLLIAGLILSALLFPPGRALSSVRRLLPRLTNPAISPALQPAGQDAHTLLSLSFDNTLNGADGETPTTASGTSFQSGISNLGVSLPNGNQLFYQSSGNIDAKEGTFECWLNPAWNGNDGQTHAILQYGVSGGMLIAKDGANNLRIILNRFGGAGGSEAGVAYNVSSWTAGQWHHIAFVWSDNSKTLKLYIDGTLKSQAGFSISLPAISSSTFRLGADGAGSYLNAVIDEVRISDIERSTEEITADFLKNLTVSSWTFEPAATNIEMYPGWFYWVPLTIRAVTNAGNLSLPPSAATWSSSNPGVAVFDASGRIKGVSPGTATLTATLGSQSSSISVNILQPALPPVEETIDPYLATPVAGYLIKMPVVILRYFPTRDGVNLDAAASGDGSTLADVKARMERLEKQHKFMLEEGSRFRGYKDPQSPPALGYQVVRIVTVYEDIPPGFPTSSAGVYFPDYQQILARFGAENLVNNLGVKEFWIEHYHHGRIAPNESNMSSPLTGDISNSFRTQGDLPVFQRSYLVYGINFSRSANEATHNHGHQLEAILSHVNQLQDGNTTLFWNQFSGTQHPAGRCGNTHFPPNGTGDYDYDNPNPVQSDCEDWTPVNTGQKKPVNNQTWGSIPYQWPDGIAPGGKTEAQYYIYWMQNMPGRGNVIPHGSNRMSNWWAFTGDWDASIRAGLGLYEPGTCAWTISATNQTVDAAGGSGSVNVTCGSGCKWIASSNAEWITLNGNPFGAGNGSVNFTAAPNPGPGARTGTIAIAGQTFTVTQNAPALPPSGTITVNTTADTVANDGFCSLREAIIAANTNTASGALAGECAAGQAGQDTIQFSLGSGTPGIAVTGSALPTITEPVQLLGNTGGATRIELNGAGAGAGGYGLMVAAGNSLIRNLVINRFDSHGIVLAFLGGNTIQGCYLGTDASGMTALSNKNFGLYLQASGGNLIGGTDPTARNLISGNLIGLFIGADSAGNTVQGNYIGVNVSGNAALPNNDGGLWMEGAGHLIGGSGAAARNLISGNDGWGILMNSSQCRIEGNFIGTDVTGLKAVPNRNTAILTFPDRTVTDNVIGGTAAGAGNLISGNLNRGIHLWGARVNGNRIEGNLVGTDVTGKAALGNAGEAIIIEEGSNNVVGGTNAAARNIVSGNNGQGVVIARATATGNQVQGNYIGVDITGKVALGNQGTGVVIENAPGNLIGGTAAGARNVVAANFQGIILVSSNAKGNRVEGNYVGTDVTGTVALSNVHSGISVGNAPGNVIGGTTAGAGNLISGNRVHGVDMGGTDSTGNRVEGNLIGTDSSGMTALPNGREGIRIEVATDNIIGGIAAGARNVISGNNLSGIILGVGATRNRVEGNFIGTNISGTAAVPNNGHGVWLGFIGDAPNNAIGGTTAGAGNLISGNQFSGIAITGAGSSGNKVQGNYIGTNAGGSAALPNQTHGIYLDRAPGNIIGGDEAGARNVISGNTGRGIEVRSPDNRILGNYIGTNAAGNAALPNGATGIILYFQNNIVGGTTAASRNLISGNKTNGITLFGQFATGNLVAGNYIGTNADGAAAIPNGFGGIDIVLGAANNIIGGIEAGARNLISGNEVHEELGLGNGIFFDNAGSGNRVQGNYIGTNKDGSSAIPNKGFGIYSFASSGNLIGGTEVGARNLISGNLFSGVGLQVGSGNRVEGNYIGTNADGTAGIANGGGVLVGLEASNNSIGGLAPGAGNLIAFNQFDGVIIFDSDETSSSFNVPVLSNSIHSNQGLGIDLSPPAEFNGNVFSVVTPNDTGDGDAGPNHLQNFPVLSSAVVAGGQLTIAGSLNSEANKTYLVQFFACAVCDASSRAEGQTLIGQATLTTDNSGNALFAPVFPLVVPSGQIITATATLMNGSTPTDTSEFAAGIAACVAPTIATQPVSQSVLLSSPVTFSVTAAGTGPFTYQWRKDGANIPNANGSTYNIPATSYASVGSYDVVVTGACGTVTSAAAALTIYNTAAGNNSMVEINAGNASIKLTFASVSVAGNTTVTPIPTAAIPKLPDSFALVDNNPLAFEIKTTATYTGPITVCFRIPSVSDPDVFANLRVLHGENGVLIDRTSSHDFAIRTICATVSSLSPFVIARLVEAPFGPGDPAQASAALSEQKAGSVLIFNYYTSSASNPAIENARLNLTNADPTRVAWVHLFFVDGSNCSVADSFVCLTPNQTMSLLASDFDPGVSGYLVAVAVDQQTGCPIRFNRLIGDEYIRTQTGHETNLGAVAISAVSGTPAVCNAETATATLNFDGLSYNALPRALAVDSLPSPQDGNATLLILNRIGGSLATTMDRLDSVFGLLFNDVETGFSFGFSGGCQFRQILSNSFPRTTPRLGSIVPAGHTGWMKLWTTEEGGILGAVINANSRVRTDQNAFGQGHNLHHLTLTSRASLTIPVHPPGCN